MNVVLLIGRLTRDPELKYGQSGTPYARFSLAVNREMKKDEVDFINCVAFGKTAELIGEYLRKGRRVAVQGRIQTGKYESNGEKRNTFDILVSTIEFLENKSSYDNDFSPMEPQSFQASQKTQLAKEEHPTDSFEDDSDDEFPF